MQDRPSKKRFLLAVMVLLALAIAGASLAVWADPAVARRIVRVTLAVGLGLALLLFLVTLPRIWRRRRGDYFRSDYSLHIPQAGLVFSSLVLLVTILALTSGNNLLYLLFAVLMATGFVSLFTSRLMLSRVHLSIRYPDHIFAGEATPFDLAIENRRRVFPVFSLAVSLIEQAPWQSWREESEAIEMGYFPILSARTEGRVRVDRRFSRRGVYGLRALRLETRFPFGFIEQRRMLEVENEIVVYPAPRPLEDFINFLPLNQGRVESQTKGSGSDLYAIRQYLLTDHHHHIDWKATARTTQLMVREFTRDDDWRVTIALDSQAYDLAVESGEEKYETAIVLAASLVKYFIDEGAEVRLVTEMEDAGFGSGQAHGYSLFELLARLPARVEASPETRSRNPFKRWRRARLEEAPPEEVAGLLEWMEEPGREDQFIIFITPAPRATLSRLPGHRTHIIHFDELPTGFPEDETSEEVKSA